jgi:hypothetical protein
MKLVSQGDRNWRWARIDQLANRRNKFRQAGHLQIPLRLFLARLCQKPFTVGLLAHSTEKIAVNSMVYTREEPLFHYFQQAGSIRQIMESTATDFGERNGSDHLCLWLLLTPRQGLSHG